MSAGEERMRRMREVGKRSWWPRTYLEMWAGWAASQVRRMMSFGGGIEEVWGGDVDTAAAVGAPFGKMT